jgi:hypothetical protein
VSLCGSTPIVTIYLVPSLDQQEADDWRTRFSRGDATLLLGHASTSLSGAGRQLCGRSATATTSKRVSPAPPRTIHYAPHKHKDAHPHPLTESLPVEQLALVPFSFPTYANALGRAAIGAAVELDQTGKWALDHLVATEDVGVPDVAVAARGR